MSSVARKLFLSVIAVVLSVLAFGTTTFAWFTITNVSEVQAFQSDIVTDNGIEVSLDGITWVTSLSKEMIDDYIALKYPSGFVFNHVTTATGLAGSFYTLSTDGVTDNNAAGSVLEITLKFRSNNATSVQWTSVSLTGTSVLWSSDVAFTRSSADVGGTPVLSEGQFLVNPANAMRISIKGNHASDNVIVYELPDGDNDGAYNSALGGDGVTPVDFSLGGIGEAGSYNYYFKKSDTLITGTDQVVTAGTVTAINNQVILNMTEDPLYSLRYWGEIEIKIWFEGWDAEAYNSLLGRMITTSFSFTGVSV